MDLSKICDAVDKVYKSNRVQDSRPTTDFIFSADSTSVNDNKGHFPIPDVEHGRNAIARVNQYSSLPKWYSGKMNLKQLVEHVVNEVHKKFPSIEVSKDAKISKPEQVKDSFTGPDLVVYVEHNQFDRAKKALSYYYPNIKEDSLHEGTKLIIPGGDKSKADKLLTSAGISRVYYSMDYRVEDSSKYADPTKDFKAHDEYMEFVKFFSDKHSSEEIKEKVKEYRSKFGDRTIVTPDRKELVAFAEYQDGTPVYSYKQKAWEKIEDSSNPMDSMVFVEEDGELQRVYLSRKDGDVAYLTVDEDGDSLLFRDIVGSKAMFENFLDGGYEKVVSYKRHPNGSVVVETEHVQSIEDCGPVVMSDVDAEIPGKTKPVDDSRQDEDISYSWDDFEKKLIDYEELKDHKVIIEGRPYLVSGKVIAEEKVGDSADYRIEDDREYSKQQLIDRPPLWIKDKDIWEKAVDKATRGGSKDTTVVVPIVIYKRMGGTKALNKKEKEERTAADERRMQAETSREGVEDSMYEKIKVGDTLRIVRGNHVGKFAEVLEVKEDGSYRLKDLQTNEEFEEPADLFGVWVTVTDSGYSDSEDGVSLRSALATILKETDPKVRQRSIQSKVLSFLNAYGMDAEIESDGKIWLNDDDTSVRVDESTVSIKKGGETKTEDYALLEDIEKWYGRIKELSGK